MFFGRVLTATLSCVRFSGVIGHHKCAALGAVSDKRVGFYTSSTRYLGTVSGYFRTKEQALIDLKLHYLHKYRSTSMRPYATRLGTLGRGSGSMY